MPRAHKSKEPKEPPPEVVSVYGRRGSSVDELVEMIGRRLDEMGLPVLAPAGAHDAWIPRFLGALTMSANWTVAAMVAGVHRSTPYDRAEVDEAFKKAAQEAIEQGVEMIEASAYKSAVHGDLKPIFHMGVRVGEVVEYSDRMRELLLKAHKPEKYRERVSMDTTVHDTRPVESPEERRDRVMELLPQLANYLRFTQAKPIQDMRAGG